MKTSLSISVVYSVILMALFNLMIFVSDASASPAEVVAGRRWFHPCGPSRFAGQPVR